MFDAATTGLELAGASGRRFMETQPVGVGAQAPDFVLPGASARSLSLDTLRGLPVVVAFVDDWDVARERAEDLASIRAELRGLGAVLVILSRRGVWWFSPDDDIERAAATSDELDVAIARAKRAYGLAGRRASAAIFVLD